jgi:hypothetical protein
LSIAMLLTVYPFSVGSPLLRNSPAKQLFAASRTRLK